MSKGLEVNVEIGLCTKDMAKENPVKDFEILIEEYKDKWSKQMYDYFKECLNEIKKKEKASEIIKHFIKSKSLGLTFIFLDDEKKILTVGGDEFECWYNCETQEEYDSLKEVLL